MRKTIPIGAAGAAALLSAWGTGCTTSRNDDATATNTRTVSATETPAPTSTPTTSWTPVAPCASPSPYVYLVGGDDGSVAYADVWSALLGGPAIPGWTTGSSLPSPLSHVALAAGPSHLYAAGGSSANYTTASAQVASAPACLGTVGPWAPQAPLPTPYAGLELAHHAASQRLVVWGGLVASGTPNAAGVSSTVYQAAANGAVVSNWQTAPALPFAHGFGTSTYANGYAYAISGFWCPSSCVLSGEVHFAQISGAAVSGWSSTSPLPVALDSHQAASDGSYVFVTGALPTAYTTPVAYSAPIVAGGALGAWTSQLAPPLPVVLARMAARGGRLYVMGGFSAFVGNSSAVYVATLAGGTILGWTTAAALPAARRSAGGGAQ